jgi:hypothetical protein
MQRVFEWISCSLASLGIALLAFSIALVPQARLIASGGGGPHASCNLNGTDCNSSYGQSDRCEFQSPPCPDPNTERCDQKGNATDCGGCKCTNVQEGCYCKG